MSTCPTCGQSTRNAPGPIPAEPAVGIWVKDRHGGVSMHHDGGGWAPKGCMPFGKWEAMWEARGPLTVCGPWGADLESANA